MQQMYGVTEMQFSYYDKEYVRYRVKPSLTLGHFL